MSKQILLALFLSIFFVSCKKDSDESRITTTNASDGFRWKENSSTTFLTVNNPYASQQFKTIFATRTGAGAGTIFEINLTSIAVGTYNFTASGTNAFYYNNNATGGAFNAVSGSVIITANDNNKLTGTFSVTGTGNGVTSVTGEFVNITINP
jgi:hypothetical protein